jgi:hypothetical protein
MRQSNSLDSGKRRRTQAMIKKIMVVRCQLAGEAPALQTLQQPENRVTAGGRRYDDCSNEIAPSALLNFWVRETWGVAPGYD